MKKMGLDIILIQNSHEKSAGDGSHPTNNVYLFVRQLSYTAKAQKSYDGNNFFSAGEK